ncbi:MAG TPA: glycoside hydrolase family 9 protein [Longimicrobiales bacterium]
MHSRIRRRSGLALVALATAACVTTPPRDYPAAIRYNQLGYLPDAPKVAVLCSRDGSMPRTFRVHDDAGRTVIGPNELRNDGAFASCAAAARIDFSAITTSGSYTIEAGTLTATVRVAPDVYGGTADSLLAYMRQQRSRFNPFFRDSVHHTTDAILVDHPEAGTFIPVAGGWADAADYLQYVTTSGHATFVMLAAYRDHRSSFIDAYDANGLPGANGIADVLDEARWGLEWLVRMHARADLILNQIADDRDHMNADTPPTDISDYGWGPGGFRPTYPCTGRPQGLFAGKNRADGVASTAGKMAAAFALGALLLREHDAAFADTLARRARTAYRAGREQPGVCQTAPGRAPYFYEEGNWVDDMELAAAQLYALTGERAFLTQALEYAAQEPVTPWMGADTARHYEWYPWHNYGHHEIWRATDDAAARGIVIDYYRRGLDAVAGRADNGFRVGIPFIWCSNNLMAAFATQARLYRVMSGDTTYRAHEHAAIDWLFGTNPWGTSMVVGLPRTGDYPTDPHSDVSRLLRNPLSQKGGLVDGPVYRSIYENLLGISLVNPDEYEAWNTGHIVYHDDWGDYSTNEPIMDGTAVLIYVMAALAR